MGSKVKVTDDFPKTLQWRHTSRRFSIKDHLVFRYVYHVKHFAGRIGLVVTCVTAV